MSQQLELLHSAQPATQSSLSGRVTVRESARARRMFLHVQPPLGVELVVPRGTRPRTVQAFVEEHRAWIDAAYAQIDREYLGDRSMRPERIELPALGRQIGISYRHDAAARRRWMTAGDTLVVRCLGQDLGDAAEILVAWLMQQARAHLPAQVYARAATIGVRPQQIQVRLQRTRWGSCSARGTISVNAALLFLEPEYVDYLVVHELCHMLHLNHSRAYWRCVERFVPQYRSLDRALARAWQRVPWWVVTALRSGPRRRPGND